MKEDYMKTLLESKKVSSAIVDDHPSRSAVDRRNVYYEYLTRLRSWTERILDSVPWKSPRSHTSPLAKKEFPHSVDVPTSV